VSETPGAVHRTFTVDRTIAASPARVFQAFADIEVKARWFTPPPGWRVEDRAVDFSIGGFERHRNVPPTGPAITFEARYHDIVPERRIIYSYAMAMGDAPISVSLATIELVPVRAGTRLTVTEQGAYLGAGRVEAPAQREAGTAALMDAMAALVETHGARDR
jgi:uncharacterized protein YndB with AHSA1/START domain